MPIKPFILMSLTACVMGTFVTTSYATITITDGQATFTMRNGTFTGGAWAADLFTHPGSPDHLFRNQWYYRTQSQIMEHQLSSDNNTAEGAVGSDGFIEWSESGFNFRLDVSIESASLSEPTAQVLQAMSVTNTTDQIQSIHLFNYSDFEFGGFLSSNFASRDAYGIEVTKPGIAGTVGRMESGAMGVQPSHWQVDDSFVILDQLDDAFVTTLTDSNNQTFDDTTAVLEFIVTVEPGETVVVGDSLQVVQSPFSADLTGDGVVNFFDVSLFLSQFAIGQREADFTNDGLFNFFDITAFVSAYSRDATP
ncbi:MAG: GC-type dockerin domain-anchored protein [Phycisphaerales bacterium]